MKTVKAWTKVAGIVLALIVGAMAPARAGLVTSLSASPPEISAGGTTNLNLSITYTPQAAGYIGTTYNGNYEYVSYYTGSGGISNVSGSILAANGQSFSLPSPTTSGTTYTASDTAQYSSPGSYLASASGNALVYDQEVTYTSYDEYTVLYYNYYNGNYYPVYGYQWVSEGSSISNLYSNLQFSAQTPVQVDPVSTPEPSTFAMAGMGGLMALAYAGRRRARAAD